MIYMRKAGQNIEAESAGNLVTVQSKLYRHGH